MTIILPDPEPPQPNHTELRINRKLTRAFILAAPVVLTLVPRGRVKKPAGGWVYEDLPARQPQVMKLIEPTLTVGTTRPTVTTDGIERSIDFILLGEYDALIGVYDRFDHDDSSWEVVQLLPDNGYERRAVVSRRADV